MMIVADVSWWQEPMDVAQMAPSMNAVFVRWCDWKNWTNGQDDDPDYNTRLAQFRQHGVPSTGYLFARPEMASAQVQIDTWAQRTTAGFDFSPMLDVEVSGIVGAQLMDWVEAALTRMTAIWGHLPVWYSNANLAIKLQTTPPLTPHILMVPGYPHRDVPPVLYRQGHEQEWVGLAGGPGTVADYLPPQYALSAVGLWQFSSTAHIAGTANTVDVSQPYPPFLAQFDKPPPVEPPPVEPPPDNPRVQVLIALLREQLPVVIAGREALPDVLAAIEELYELLPADTAHALIAKLSSTDNG